MIDCQKVLLYVMENQLTRWIRKLSILGDEMGIALNESVLFSLKQFECALLEVFRKSRKGMLLGINPS